MDKVLTKGQINYQKYKSLYIAWRKKVTPELRKKYRANSLKTLLKCNRRWRNKDRFGGMREVVLERDEYKCVLCGMTNDEHIKKWGREITVDHIDGSGRNSNTKNNNLDNLRTLCLVCHGKYDIGRYLSKKGEK